MARLFEKVTTILLFYYYTYNSYYVEGASNVLNVTALIVFGDSTLDVGMNNQLLTPAKSNFFPYGINFEGGKPTGRFCDGQITTDYVATYLGLPFPLPYFDPQAKGANLISGVNFASGASGYNTNTSKLFNVISLVEQLELYDNYQRQLVDLLGQDEASHIISNALHVISTGNNDYINNYFFNKRLQKKYTLSQYTDLLLQFAQNFIEDLYSKGARRLVVVNIGPLGCIPSQRTIYGLRKLDLKDCVEHINEVISSFNQGLQSVVQNVNSKYPDYIVAYVDTYGPLLDMYHNPSKYGFVEVTRGCCSTGLFEASIFCNPLDGILSCEDPSRYLFWDGFHPTQYAYKILANMYIESVLRQVKGKIVH